MNRLPVQKNKPNSNPILVDSCWSLSRIEFTPHGVYPARSLPRTSMRGCGDAGMRGRNNIFLPDVLFLVTMNRCFSENVIMTIVSFWKNIEKTLVLRKKYGCK